MENYFLVQRRKAIRAKFFDDKIKITPTEDKSCSNESRYEGEDLSTTGIRVKTLSDKLNEKAEVNITLFHIFTQNERREITAKGTVIWRAPVNDEGKNEWKLGIEFHDLRLEDKEAISQSIVSDRFTEEQKAEFKSLRWEINNCANNCLRINIAVITVTITFLGASLLAADKIYLPLLPLFVIALGFQLFKQQLEIIRRIATYLRNFIEPLINNLNWESYIYSLRKSWHSGKKYYSKGYYYVALLLSPICFFIGGWRVWNLLQRWWENKIPFSQAGVPFFIYLVAGFVWFSNELPQIKKQNKDREGAEKFEKELDCYAKQIKRYNEGFCPDFKHLSRILHILFGREKIKFEEDLGKLDRTEKGKHCSCCPLNSIIHNLKNKLSGLNPNSKQLAVLRKNRVNCFFVALLIAVLFICAISYTYIAVFYNSAIRFSSPICYKNPIFWLALLFLLVFVIKVKIRNIYYKIFKDGKETLIKIDWLQQCNKLNSQAENALPEFPPSDYTKPKLVPLFSWMFYYGWKKTLAREKICFLREEWAVPSRGFFQYMWVTKIQ